MPLPPASLLDRVLHSLEKQMRPDQFDTWFRGFTLGTISNEEIEYRVPSGFVRDWLNRNYLDQILGVTHAVLREAEEVERPVRITMDAALAMEGALEESPTCAASEDSTANHAAGGNITTGGHAAAEGATACHVTGSNSAGAARRVRDPHRVQEVVENVLGGVGQAGAGSLDIGAAGLPNTGMANTGLPNTGLGNPGVDAPGLGGLPAGSNGGAGLGSGAPSTSVAAGAQTSPRRLVAETPLNKDYTFEQFVVGPSNQLSHAASLAVGQNPGRAYNPLFIHGNVGLGKTHLLQSISHSIAKRAQQLRVVYLSCEEFTNRFILAIQTRKLEEFRDYYRTADVLVIDDVQFLAGKDKTQEEFFHTFNALYNSHKQIVFSSDRPPVDIPTVEDRLLSRFKWGLVTDIQQPCYETRLAIVRRKALMRAIDLDDEVANFIAERISTNVREVEGAVIKVIGVAAITDRPICLNLAEEALRGVAASRSNQISIPDVISMITSEFSVSARDLTGKSRTQKVSLPRQIGMFLSREYTDHSLEEVGRYFGNRDHTTVLYAVTKIKKRSKTDRMFRELLTKLSGRLESGNFQRPA